MTDQAISLLHFSLPVSNFPIPLVKLFLNIYRKYRVERVTSNLKVHYWVKDDFRAEFKSDLRRIERAVEEEYISQLRSNCFRERNYSECIDCLFYLIMYSSIDYSFLLFYHFVLVHFLQLNCLKIVSRKNVKPLSLLTDCCQYNKLLIGMLIF